MAVSFWTYIFIVACFSVFALFYSRTLLESVSRPFAVRRPGTARPIVVKKEKKKKKKENEKKSTKLPRI